ncbi:glycoprotease family-domain-containing protein [Trichoderma asperelloides]|nr:glycoprotease family-domain-containing protein [Trichoderma asperelloides]
MTTRSPSPLESDSLSVSSNDEVSPIEDDVQTGLQAPPPTPALFLTKVAKHPSMKVSMRRSTARTSRPVSRRPPKQRNAKLGITLITDMTKLRRQNHIANQAKSPARRNPKFADAAALRALEGSPNPQSVGNWNWLRRGNNGDHVVASPSPLQADDIQSPDEQLSPEARPIVIGITLPSDEVESRGIDPLTATVNNIDTPNGEMRNPYPFNFQTAHDRANPPSVPTQLKSMWSPDTPDTASSFSTVRYPSSVYSQASMAAIIAPGLRDDEVPPVPALPAGYKQTTSAMPQRLIGAEQRKNKDEEDESGTPCTLFEEDGITPLKSPASKLSARTPDSVRGWWDHHLVTPFLDMRMSFASSERPIVVHIEINTAEQPQKFVVDRVGLSSTPTIKIPTPRRTPSPQGDVLKVGVAAEPARGAFGHHEAGTREMVQGLGITNLRADTPPSPSSKKHAGAAIKYQAVFPPGHHLHTQVPQTEVPHNVASAPAPVAPVMTTVPVAYTTHAAHTAAPIAASTAAAPTTSRLRHEKEEKMARRAGGLWRGRGCVPKKGCFGRPGPEGRKKRRIWCCIIGFLLLLIIILAIILGVVLSRHHGSGSQSSTPAPGESQSPSSPSKPSPLPSSVWVNLTDYPAMPTGVLTFVGPNNTVAKSDCTEPSTLWSCSLPKDSQASVSPFNPNQPTIIFQIQWDNSTDKAWNIPNGAPPTPISKRGESNGKSTIDGFNPEPSPPTFDEMWFLGETTDNIQSSQKAGEPTPFFISILESLNDTVKLPSLSRRAAVSDILNISDIIFPPDLKADGTPAPAVMLPNPVQQPVRLFDRGLPTEHYGFYTYFQRTIFLKSVTALNKSSEGNVPADENGGCSETEANHLVTWAETRMLVQIWTRKLNSTGSLLPSDGSEGTMPYPVTVTLDTHGGDPDHKVKLNTSAPELLGNNMAAGGTWINHRGSGNATFGGFDGGTGGCKCQWANCVNRSLTTLAIETSCDDTAVAVLSKSANGKTALLFNERISSDNRAFKGINPMVTVEGHNSTLALLVEKALESLPDCDDGDGDERRSNRNGKKKMKKKKIPDFVCATRGPGIMPNLSVGLNVAKGLALAWQVPLVGVHHMQAHALTPRLVHALENSSSSSSSITSSSPTSTSPSSPASAPPISPAFPFLSLLVSGGHTQLILSSSLTAHQILATTADVAIGNLLDQTARVILPPSILQSSPDVSYGRVLEAFAFPPGQQDTPADYEAFFKPALSRRDEIDGVPSREYGWAIALPYRNSRKLAYSFSSIHTQVHDIVAAIEARYDDDDNASSSSSSSSSSSDVDKISLDQRRALARHTLRASFQHLVSRLILALQDHPSLQQSDAAAIKTLVVAGGVASNRFLMHVLRTTLAARGFPDMHIVAPPVELCTDNAAMIAWAGMEMFEAGYRSELSVRPIARWPMDPAVGGGMLGVGGWIKVEEEKGGD